MRQSVITGLGRNIEWEAARFVEAVAFRFSSGHLLVRRVAHNDYAAARVAHDSQSGGRTVRVADIFISDTKSDVEWAFWIAKELEALGICPRSDGVAGRLRESFGMISRVATDSQYSVCVIVTGATLIFCAAAKTSYSSGDACRVIKGLDNPSSKISTERDSHSTSSVPQIWIKAPIYAALEIAYTRRSSCAFAISDLSERHQTMTITPKREAFVMVKHGLG
jgi:hypothetical protein